MYSFAFYCICLSGRSFVCFVFFFWSFFIGMFVFLLCYWKFMQKLVFYYCSVVSVWSLWLFINDWKCVCLFLSPCVCVCCVFVCTRLIEIANTQKYRLTLSIFMANDSYLVSKRFSTAFFLSFFLPSFSFAVFFSLCFPSSSFFFHVYAFGHTISQLSLPYIIFIIHTVWSSYTIWTLNKTKQNKTCTAIFLSIAVCVYLSSFFDCESGYVCISGALHAIFSRYT